MIIEQIYTGCLEQGAYYIQSGNEAAIIDPLREVEPYINKATSAGVQIKYVFETHFHADFVSGHLDLAQKTGAQIIYGPKAETGFHAYVAHDHEEFKVGEAIIRVLHTPGHTIESTCYLLIDEAGKETALFSGDTLFIGDVGRPDLAQKSDSLTKQDLAGYLYESLRAKIMTLSDDILVYPAHGAGSACGKNMSKETSDTLGNQKRSNYALRSDMTKAEFIAEVTQGLQPPPAYFPLNVKMNKDGYESFEKVLYRGMRPLTPDNFEIVANAIGALMLDTRDAQSFAKEFIPNAINIGIDGSFAPWVGALIPDIDMPILLIAEDGREEEVLTRLARVGYDNAVGFLQGGVAAWKASGKETDSIRSVTPEELNDISKQQPIEILDVRKESEFTAEHLLDAENFPLDHINDHLAKLDRKKTYYVHCAGGYRSMIFNSMLRARGFEDLVDVKGGFKALKGSGGFEISNYVCPSTLL
ncbi:MBL fold metallo-hydrolase [Mucilaginibacter sp. 21P]|uniref:MBL fold metallo-hydrolase n=1 Tax=Mucilaginibacter sp. 21P TaxID=2778902 RepID=UPI001C58986B|nr:MBL fold metallo-hydrolase [Mucilaginibacter sp. 21P]QXV66855.1 MBL fold metallo-hydrolase [Mucilaginibacter sp. 21P]